MTPTAGKPIPRIAGEATETAITAFALETGLAFRRKIYRPIELQADLDEWLAHYNNDRTHQGRMCCGLTPTQILIDRKEAWHDNVTALITDLA